MFSRRRNWSQYNTHRAAWTCLSSCQVFLWLYIPKVLCVFVSAEPAGNSSVMLVCAPYMCACEWEHKLEMGVICYESSGRGWQPSVRSVRRGTLQAVSPRIAERKWNTLYPWSPAGQLWQGCPSITEYQHLSSPPRSPFLLSSSRSLQYACVCSARSMQRRKIERRVGAGWQVPTIACLEIPYSTRNFQRRLYLGLLFEYISSPTPRICLLSTGIMIDCMFYWLRYEYWATL